MSKSSAARRGHATRWLYQQEARVLKFNKEAMRRRPIEELRAIARKIWKVEGSKRKLPNIYATNGLWDAKAPWDNRKQKGKWTSFCLGYSHIELARHHRTLLVLIHELTHALGPCIHGPRFVSLYFRLLHKYAGYNRWFLQFVAAERNITI